MTKALFCAQKILGLLPFPVSRALVATLHRSFPEVHAIELTNHCPFRCVMCPRTHAMTRETAFMKPELFERLIIEIANHRKQRRPVWLHMFGESLLHPELSGMVRFASEHSVPTGLSLNPWALNEDKSRALVAAGIDELLFSLDGVDDESFEKVRGMPKAWGRSVENLEFILRHIAANRPGIRTTISMIGFEENQARTEEYRRHLSRLGSRVIVKYFSNWGGGVEAINRLGQSLPRKIEKRVTCLKPWFSISVNAQGKVLPCCFDYNGVMELGDANERPLAQIWRDSAFLREMRRAFISNDLAAVPFCRDCSELRAPLNEAYRDTILSPGGA